MATTPIQQLRANLAAIFPERKPVIGGALRSILAGEHILLLGPPGTAKSALARAVAQAFSGVYFERLLTKFSTPEELFGPVSLKALEQDRFARVVTGKLPEAEFAFVDEMESELGHPEQPAHAGERARFSQRRRTHQVPARDALRCLERIT
jgi:MoxR-like ATPase